MSRLLSFHLTTIRRLLVLGVGLCCFATASANTPASIDKKTQEAKLNNTIEHLSAPLYTPFIERYMLDEIKDLRVTLAAQKHELMQQILDREHHSIDRGVTYATDTITYFFYLIAAATSVLVLVGWKSMHDIKERAHSLADEEISRIVQQYEQRLEAIENEVKSKSQHIRKNKEDIELTQEVQSLWLRAQQEASPAGKISIYDKILTLKKDDCEALTYKADSVLELNEPQWAANLCHQALDIDPQNSHAFYQLGCVYTALNNFDEAVHYLQKAITKNEAYRSEINADPALKKLKTFEPFEKLVAVAH